MKQLILNNQLSPSRTGMRGELVGLQNGETLASNKTKLLHSAIAKSDAQLADKHKVSRDTIIRDAAYAKAVDTVATVAPEVAPPTVLSSHPGADVR